MPTRRVPAQLPAGDRDHRAVTPMPITTGPAVDLPGPVAAVVVAALIVIAAGAPLGVLAPRISPPSREEPTVQPAPLAATEEEQRSPDWCWTHGCHRSQCPQPEPQGGDNQ